MQGSRLPTIVIADELALFRDGLAALCELQGYARVVARAIDGDEALRQIESLSPDLALLDLSLSRLHCLELANRISGSSRVRCVIMGLRNDRKTIIEVLRSGAQGYLLKTATAAQFHDCLIQVSEGGIYVSPTVDIQSIFTPGRIGARHDPISLLSAREYQVFSLLVEGVRAKEIAARLGLSPKTVDTHRSNLMKKLDLHDVPALVRFALHHRLIPA
ncbi:MAG TPA: response regulator transcription factor [Paludibaculum sp.]|jgi:DNA-binding NarL/FixJ family response regulator